MQANDILTLKKGGYRLLEPLKQGGQGEVWRAEGPDGGLYALKTVRTGLDDAQVWANIENIRAEIAALESLADPEADFIIPCRDAGHWRHDRFGDIPVFVMPLMAGSLKDLKEPPDGETLLRWAGQIARAIGRVQALHGERGTSHRDLKPANILLTAPGGDLRLIDFGIAKRLGNDLTRDPNRDGEFFAPEQVLPARLREANGSGGEGLFRITTACDLYNLGLILHWLIRPDRALPESQADLPDAALSKAHYEGIAQGGPGLLGRIGGLSATESARLQRLLLERFGGDPGATLVPAGVRALPDREHNAACMAAWVKRLLAPAPEDRPSAAEAEAGFAGLRQALRPRIGRLEARVDPADIEAGQPLTLAVTVAGEGLPASGRWLGLNLDDAPLTLEPEALAGEFLTGEATWRFHWTPAVGDEGERRLRVRCLAGEERHDAECPLRVSATADQLWAAGRHWEALERDPREDWLDRLEAEAATPRRRVAFMDGLLRLSKLHPDTERLQSRLTRLEKDVIHPRRWGWQWLFRALALLLALSALGGTGLWGLKHLDPIRAGWAGLFPAAPPAGEIPRVAGMPPEALRALQRQTAQGLGLPLNEDGFSFRDCGHCPPLAVLPAAEFRRGGLTGEPGDGGESGRWLKIGRPIAMAVTETTLGQFAAFVADQGYRTLAEREGGCYVWGGVWQLQRGLDWRDTGFEQTPDHPAACLGQADMEAYAQWLSRKTGRRYRLPTEAEWEYAALGAGETRYAWGDEAPACEPGRTNGARFGGQGGCPETGAGPVAAFRPNPFGLHDLNGNLWEWTCSAYTRAPQAETLAACAPAGAAPNGHAARGGSWGSGPKEIRSSMRTHRLAQARDIYSGFRLVVEF